MRSSFRISSPLTSSRSRRRCKWRCVLVKTKEPKIEWHVSQRNPTDLIDYLANAGYVAREIAVERFYKRPGMWCTWCDYLPVCLKDEKKMAETLVHLRAFLEVELLQGLHPRQMRFANAPLASRCSRSSSSARLGPPTRIRSFCVIQVARVDHPSSYLRSRKYCRIVDSAAVCAGSSALIRCQTRCAVWRCMRGVVRSTSRIASMKGISLGALASRICCRVESVKFAVSKVIFPLSR
jgi:hypothetical protein